MPILELQRRKEFYERKTAYFFEENYLRFLTLINAGKIRSFLNFFFAYRFPLYIAPLPGFEPVTPG